MNDTRYRTLEDGSVEVHPFTQPYNSEVWLDASILELDNDGSYYKFYNEDGTPNIVAINNSKTETIKTEAVTFLKDTNHLVPTDVQATLSQDEVTALANDRAKALAVINGTSTMGVPVSDEVYSIMNRFK